jgi:Flp pilus assembly protein TadD/tRNA A-37 threonylcarbamoyl transferase component Bud32
MHPEQDRQILQLALAAGWLDEQQVRLTEQDRASDSDTPLTDLLVRRGWLSPEHRAELERRLVAPVQRPASPDAGWTAVLADIPGVEQRGRYVLEPGQAPLEGGMGRVWQVQDDQLGRRVALKEMREETRDVPALRRRFLIEAQITAQLEHPGIVPVYELRKTEDGSGPFYTMRFVEGRTLSEAARAFHRSPARGQAENLALRDLLTSFVSVCNTLAYAHARGVVHRDLKGSNIVLGRYGEVLVLDWGVARVLGTADDPTLTPVTLDSTPEQTCGAVGTPDYAAPEQAPWPGPAPEPADRIDRRTDVFGLGAVLYELLTGRAPYAGDPGPDAEERWERVRQGRVVPVRTRAPWVARPLEAVCMKALAVRPEDRYPSATELADEVRRWLSGAPVRAWPEPWAVRAGRWLRRHRTLAASGAAAAVVALGLLTAGVIYRRWEQHAQQVALRERQHAAAERCDAALADAALLRKQLRFKAARTLLEQAGVMARDSGNEDLQEQQQQAEADLNLVEELHRVREGASVLINGRWDPERRSREYPKVLAGLGLNVLDGKEDVVERIRTLAVRDEVLAGLEDWMAWEPDGARQLQLLELTQQIDPSAWREEVAQAVRSKSRARLLQILARTDPRRLSPGSAIWLATLAGLDAPESRRLLALAREGHPDDFWLHFTVGNQFEGDRATRGASDLQEAIGSYRAALALKPDSPAIHTNLGNVLRARGDVAGAIRYHREAIRLDARDPLPHYNLGVALDLQGNLEEAVRCYRETLRLDPGFAPAHSNLGFALQRKGDVEGAIRSYKEAIRLDPRLAQAHTNLGYALNARGDLEGAIRCFREAIRVDPRHAQSWSNLGYGLHARGDTEAAIPILREAIRLDPRHAKAHYNLGNALHAREDLEGALRSLREAIRLDPQFPGAHTSLGRVLLDKGDPEGAIRCHHDALRLDPRYTNAHYNLGMALHAQGDLEGAARCFREVIRLDPRSANAHGALGHSLLERGDFAAARVALERALASSSFPASVVPETRKLLERCKRGQEAEQRLQAVLTGQATPRDTRDRLALGSVAVLPAQQHYATAARLFHEALTARPDLADDPRARLRYNAACAAAQAGCGHGKDSAGLSAIDRTAWRRQALTWLDADLRARRQQLTSGQPGESKQARQSLTHWRKDQDLACVRDAAALMKLPREERQAWQDFWSRVEALLRTAGEP